MFRLLEAGLLYDAPKFIVYKSCLAELLECCPHCGLSCAVTWHVVGTLVAVTRQCSRCVFSNKWYSQPMINDIPAGNLHLSAAVYYSGASFAKIHRVFAALRLESINSSTFYRHVQQLLQPTILSVWNDHQQQLLDALVQRPGDIVLGGDMRADSPGHCAKYGSYTVMELSSNRLVYISLIQV